MTNARNVLTIAAGKKVYVDMAVNLARSFRFWNNSSAIQFFIATDIPEHIPEALSAYVQIIPFMPGSFGKGFEMKLHLDKIAPEGQTLFVDSDCLIYGDISHVFEQFEGHCVSVVGNYISGGEWFGDIANIIKNFGIDRIPKFNGGIYYIEKGEEAGRIYESARQLASQYDEIGFVRLRNLPNDEVVMALAMALHGQSPILDDGTIMSDPLSCPGRFKTDILKGKTSLHNPPKPHKMHQDWYPFQSVQPLIIHFLGHHSLSYQYKSDACILRAMETKAPRFRSKMIAVVTIEIPMRLKSGFKRTFRPVFRAVFGTRGVKQSERI